MMLKNRTCNNCRALMIWNEITNSYTCNVCGNSEKEKSGFDLLSAGGFGKNGSTERKYFIDVMAERIS